MVMKVWGRILCWLGLHEYMPGARAYWPKKDLACLRPGCRENAHICSEVQCDYWKARHLQ